MSRSCVDCGDQISIRARRCPPCKKEYRAQAARERRAGESGREYDGLISDKVVDYTLGGYQAPLSAIAAPQTSGAQEDSVAGGRVQSPALRRRQADLSGLTNAQRRDHYNIEREWVREILAEEAEESEVTSWDALQARNTRQSNTVDFSRSPVDSGGLRGGRVLPPITNPAAAGMLYGAGPDYRAHAAGNAVTRVQPPRPESGSQKTPHIIY